MFKVAEVKATFVRQTDYQMVTLKETGKDGWQSVKLILQKGLEPSLKYNILFTYGSDTGEPW